MPRSGDLASSTRIIPTFATTSASPTRRVSAPGFLVEALARRRAAGAAPFTVVSCDNLPSNGATARDVV